MIETVHLSVPDYSSRVTEVLYHFQKNSILCDCVITCKDGTVPAHRLLLTMWGYHHLSQDGPSHLDASDYSSAEVQLLLKLLYTGNASMSVPETIKLSDIGSVFGIKLATVHSTDAEGHVSVLGQTKGFTSKVCSLHQHISDMISHVNNIDISELQVTVNFEHVKNNVDPSPKTQTSSSLDVTDEDVENDTDYSSTTCENVIIGNNETSCLEISEVNEGDVDFDVITSLCVSHSDTGPLPVPAQEVEISGHEADMTPDKQNGADFGDHDSYITKEQTLQDVHSACIRNQASSYPTYVSATNVPYIVVSDLDKIVNMYTKSSTHRRKRKLPTSLESKEIDLDNSTENSDDNLGDTQRQHIAVCKYCSENPFSYTIKVEEDLFTEHKRLNHANSYIRNVKCDVCGFLFKRIQTGYYWEHRYKKHGIEFDETKFPKYCCKVKDCEYWTLMEKRFKEHMTGCHPNQPFICQLCGISVKTRQTLVRHLEVHENKSNNRTFLCDVCGQSFHSRKYLKRHIDVVHNHIVVGRPRMFSQGCERCDRSFTDRRDYYAHLLRSHQIKPPDDCKIKIYTCKQCDYLAFYPQEMMKHETTHEMLKGTLQNTHECSGCNKKFPTHFRMKIHYKRAHADPILDCPECGKQCKKNNLKKHIKEAHEGQKHMKIYACHMCTYSCYRYGNLGKHVRSVHHQEVITLDDLRKEAMMAGSGYYDVKNQYEKLLGSTIEESIENIQAPETIPTDLENKLFLVKRELNISE